MIGKEIWKIETGCDKIKKLIKNHMQGLKITIKSPYVITYTWHE